MQQDASSLDTMEGTRVCFCEEYTNAVFQIEAFCYNIVPLAVIVRIYVTSWKILNDCICMSCSKHENNPAPARSDITMTIATLFVN